MDARSENVLSHVHPDLASIIRAADQSPQPFIAVLGKRTLAAERIAVGSGHSLTMRSRHLPDKHFATAVDPDGVACAVDVAALIDGNVSYAPGREAEVFGAIAASVKAAAAKLGLPVQWGGDPVGAWELGVVNHFRDWDHFQLPWEKYP